MDGSQAAQAKGGAQGAVREAVAGQEAGCGPGSTARGEQSGRQAFTYGLWGDRPMGGMVRGLYVEGESDRGGPVY